MFIKKNSVFIPLWMNNICLLFGVIGDFINNYVTSIEGGLPIIILETFLV